MNFNTTSGGGCIGDMDWSDWGKLRELATDPSDPMGQLMTLARSWCATEPQAEQRQAA